jgi:hypothetical protein
LEKFKPGLKKDVTSIFQGVRIPNNVHPHQSPDASVPNSAGDFGPKSLSSNNQTPPHPSPQPRLWFPQETSAHKSSKFASIMDPCVIITNVGIIDPTSSQSINIYLYI